MQAASRLVLPMLLLSSCSGPDKGEDGALPPAEIVEFPSPSEVAALVAQGPRPQVGFRGAVLQDCIY